MNETMRRNRIWFSLSAGANLGWRSHFGALISTLAVNVMTGSTTMMHAPKRLRSLATRIENDVFKGAKAGAEINSQGLHLLQCPSCQSHRIESFLKVATPEFDPNNKLCRVCGYAWAQIRNES